MRPQPLIAVTDVEASSRWYQRLLGCRSAHGGKAYERLVTGDTLILQEKPAEAMTRYFTQAFLNFNVVWEAFRSSVAAGVVNVAAPDRVPGAGITVQTNTSP